jgi:hypothetical protein
MKKLINFLIGIWINAVGEEPVYTLEITKALNYGVHQLEYCRTENQVTVVADWFYEHMNRFPANQTETAKSIMRSHLAWKSIELKKSLEVK